MDGLGMSCTMLFLPFMMCMGFVLILGGGVGFGVTWKKKRILSLIPIGIVFLGLYCSVSAGGVLLPKDFWLRFHRNYPLGHEKLMPYEDAINSIDRSSLGFAPIPEDAKIWILKSRLGYVQCPEVELYISDLPFMDWSICVEKIDGRYVLVSETQEYNSPEYGFMYVIYEVEDAGGVMQEGKIRIVYIGPNETLHNNTELTIEDVKPTIEEWRDYYLQDSEIN
jgi:hypothetical protein